jgi:formamidopyrimidine-DNA glycosylase
MPELPEVETTRRGLAPHVIGRRIIEVVVRDPRLRWPITADFAPTLAGRRIEALRRRAKYLIMELDRGAAILHLGMSGALSLVAAGTPAAKHDHVDVVIEGGSTLRLTDPRRFGSLHYVAGDPEQHPLLRPLGPEPLSTRFTPEHLHHVTRGRRASIKETLMNARVVVGVGNIYASEALFRAGIDPRAAAGSIGIRRYAKLVEAVRATLADAIRAGGSSLRDWRHADGSLGYFQQQYFVYGRTGEACRRCAAPIRELRQGQRATYFCARCQRR